MKIAAVINIGPGQNGLERAVWTQALLLDRLGARLHSIRLAVPRHLRFACLAAVAEGPDVLVVAGGPRAARRAGQIAHDEGVPLIFLPGLRAPQWAGDLWDSMPLEALVDSLGKEALTPVSLGAGAVAGQIFFESVRCGVLPQIAQWPSAFREAETFSEAWQEVSRAANVLGRLVRPALRIRRDDDAEAAVGAFQITARIFAQTQRRSCFAPQLACALWNYPGLIGYGASLMRAASGGDWQRGARRDYFDCATLSVDGRSAFWLLLDGDPVRMEGLVDIRFVPRAVRTFSFRRVSAGPSLH